MQMTETLHAPPEPGDIVSPCCGRTLNQLPRYDRITLKPDQVTCNRLTVADVMILSGQPVVLDANDQQMVVMMAATVTHLTGGMVDHDTALDRVHVAIRQILPTDQPVPVWTSELMIRVVNWAVDLSQV